MSDSMSGNSMAAEELDVLDPSVLNSLRDLPSRESDSILTRVLRSYRESAPGLVAKVNSAIEACDAITLTSAAHRLGSSSASIGAIRLSRHFRKLEALGRDGTTLGAEAIRVELNREVDLVLAATLQELEAEKERSTSELG